MRSPGRFVVGLWTVATILIVAIAWLGLAIVDRLRADAIDQGAARISQAVASTESLVNRTLLSIDVLLTGLPELVSSREGPAEHESTRRQLSAVVSSNLLLRDVVLVRPDGRVIAAGLETSERLGLSLPAAFLARVEQPGPAEISVSDPIDSFEYSEDVMYIARPLAVEDRTVIAVAVVPMAQIDSALAGVDASRGETMSLERANGQPLTSVPPRPPSLAEERRLPPSPLDGHARLVGVVDDGGPTLVAVRALLYPQLLVVGSIRLESVLSRWRSDRLRVLVLAAALSLAILAASAAAHKFVNNLAAARLETMRATEWLTQALASIPEGILLCDAADKVLAWNLAYVEHFPWLVPVLQRGMPFERLAGAIVEYLLPAATNAERATWLEARLRRHHSAQSEFEEHYAGGKQVRITENATPAGGVVSVFRDVTATELELARARVSEEAAAIAKLDYLSAVTDAVVNPTNAILGNLELLLAQHPAPLLRRPLTMSLNLGQTVLSSIASMFEAAKLATGVVKLAFTKFDPVAVVEEAVQSSRDVATVRAVTMRFAPGDPLVATLWGDAARLKTALVSLLRTEAEHMTRGELVVSMTMQPEVGGRSRLLIDIAESGMTPRVRNELVSQVRRKRTAEGPAGASPLGLQIARAIAQAMQGDMTVLQYSLKAHTVRLEVVVDSLSSSTLISAEEEA